MSVERIGIQLDTMILWEGGGRLDSLAQPALPSSSSHISRPDSKASLRRLAHGPTHSKSALTHIWTSAEGFCPGW